jgi:hypothetical protein
MKSRPTLWTWTALFIAVALFAAEKPGRDKQQPAVKLTEKSLIRKDLLVPGKPRTELAGRNIFAPGLYVTEAESTESEDPAGREDRKESAAEAKPAQPEIFLTYSGYIKSETRVIALIVLDGETLAVFEGEQVREDVRIGKITLEAIEVIGPGSLRMSFPLQGVEE